MSQMQRAVVKSLPEDPNLTITLTVGGKQRNLDRPKSEPLEKPLGRLQKSAAAPPDKKQRKNAANGATSGAIPRPEALFVGLYDGPTTEHPLVDPEATPNEEAWRHGRLLRVGDVSYIIDVNPPLAERVETHGTPFVGIPVVAVPKLLFADPKDCKYKWWKRSPGSKLWEEVSDANEQGYAPRAEDSGCMLRVECTPTRKTGEEVSIGDPVYAETGPVQVPPELSSSSGRRELTPHPLSPPFFRVVTYNILADQYASTDAAKTQLFATCPSGCLDPGYRRPLVLQELLQYNADVICLQEVDDKMFTMCLEPALGLKGFEGAYTNKAGKVREGSAAFWRKDRFKLLTRRDVALKELFPPTNSVEDIAAAKYGPAFAPMLRSSPALCTALQRVATIAQLILLAPTDSSLRPICLVNTHLFFHYAAPHIRTMHVWAILQEAAELIQAAAGDDIELTAAAGGRRPALVFCGDLNSDLNDGIPGAIELLSQGRLSSEYWDWAFGVNFKWEKDEESQDGGGGENNNNDNNSKNNGAGDTKIQSSGTAEGGEVQKMMHTEVEGLRPSSPRSPEEIVPGIDLETKIGGLDAVDRLRSNVTNYVKGYDGLLDYVWYSPDKLAVQQVVPVPHTEELGGYIPNRRFPSDHLAVVADLKFIAAGEKSSTGGSGGGASAGGESGAAGAAGGFGDDVTGTGCVLPAGLYNVGVAADILNKHGMIAVPTDTIYGFAACATNEAAVARIYAAKSRAAHKPLAICVADYEDIPRYVETEHLPKGLVQDLLPGPVTLLLGRKEGAPLATALNPGVSSVGVRIPDNRFIRAVCRQHRSALALTSANVSGHLSSLSVKDFEPLWGLCDAVFDGGEIQSTREGSTILDLTVKGQYKIVRKGEGMAVAVAVLEEKYKWELAE